MKKKLIVIPLLALKAHACEVKVAEYDVYAAIKQVPKAKKYAVYTSTDLVKREWKYVGEVDKQHPSIQVDESVEYMFFKCEERK